MLNHTRTLLLNLRAADVQALSPIYIESSFIPVVPNPGFAAVTQALFPAGFTPADRVVLIDGLMPILHTPEFQPYTLWFDTRVTYDTLPPANLINLCRSTPPGLAAVSELAARMADIMPVGTVGAQLFRWPELQFLLDDLKPTWLQESDGLLRLGALVLAYVLQLERTRKS